MTEEQIIQERIAMLKELQKKSIEKGMSIDDISKQTGLLKSNIARLFLGKYAPSLDVFLKIKYAILEYSSIR